MFRIKWRRLAHNGTLITGIRKYCSIHEAERQISIWKFLFPYNEYYIEPVEINNESDWWPILTGE